MNLFRFTKGFFLGVFLGYMLASAVLLAREEKLVDFEERSLPILNEEIRLIWEKLDNHETRITTLEP